MKIKVLTGWLVLSLMIGLSGKIYPQYFRAGEHTTGNHYVNIDPDTTLTGPNNHFTTLPAAIFPIDLNNDGITDVSIYSYGSWTNGSGYSEISITIADTGFCQVAFGNADTCHTPNSTYFLYYMAKSLKKGDTIGKNLAWVNSKLYMYYTNWGANVYSCRHGSFVNDSSGNYIAVRMPRAKDTLYGWIKVTNINFLTYTVQEYACSKSSAAIDEYENSVAIYPVPAGNSVTIETRLPGFTLMVYNPYGMEILQRRLGSGKTLVDLAGKANGVYIFKLVNGNSNLVRKVIKQ